MYITINSEFRPFTYDELTKPLRDYTEAYNKAEEQYATLAQQTEAWKNIATQENSPEAYAMYKKYSDELNAIVEDFSKGMTIQNRSKLSGLKSRYASEITPIANAYNAMQAANAYRDTVKGKDDSAIFNVDRYNSLDDFLNGKMPDNTFISGKSLQTDIATQILSESYNEYEKLIREGHSEKAALNIASRGEWIDEDNVLDNIYTSKGITNEEAASKIRTYVDKGIAQGISSFAINTRNQLFEKEIETAKAYLSNSNNDNPTKRTRDDILLEIYDMFGGAQTEEVESTIEKITDEDTDYKSTESKTTKSTKNLTKERKLANARQNKDMMFALNLVEEGVSLDDVLSYYNEYQSGKTYSTFESYIESIISEE